MRRWTRRLLWMLSTLVALAVGVAAAGLLMADYRINRRVDVRVASFPLPGDAGSLEHGRHLFTSRGCVVCHGAAVRAALMRGVRRAGHWAPGTSRGIG